MILVDLVLARLDTEQFLTRHGFELKSVGGKTGHTLNRCPFCDKEWHCGVQLEKKTFGCYKCHVGGSHIKLVQKILNKDFLETLEYLKEGIDDRIISVDHIGDVLNRIKPYITPEEKLKPIELPEGYIPLINTRIPYLDTGRPFPIPQDQVHYYKMGVCLTGRYKDRIIVCDVNDKHEPIFWIARDITGRVHKSKKVLNPKIKDQENDLGSADLLFNWYLARNYDVGVITESVWDSMYVGNNGMATYGKGLKKNHIYWLIKAGFRKIILLNDGDVSQLELESQATLLSQFFETCICKIPDFTKDPDQYPKEVLYELLNNAPVFTLPEVTEINDFTRFKLEKY